MPYIYVPVHIFLAVVAVNDDQCRCFMLQTEYRALEHKIIRINADYFFWPIVWGFISAK